MAESGPAGSRYMLHTARGDGGGDPVVLLHAFPLNGAMWEPQAEALEDSRRVILPDYPGFGRAASEPVPAVPDIDYYAEALHGLLDRLVHLQTGR